MADEITSSELFHRLGTLENAIEAQTRTVDRLVQAYEVRFNNIESKIDRPFPWIQMVSAIFGGLVVVGAIFSASLQPLFTDTERNRIALIEMGNQWAEHTSNGHPYTVIKEIDGLAKQVDRHQEWLGSLRDRERNGYEKTVGLEAHFEDLKDRVDRMEAREWVK